MGDTSRITVSTVLRPSGFGVTVAVNDHSPSAPVEFTAKATPPSCGRVRLRLMCSKLQRLPLRWSSTTSVQSFRPISESLPPSSPSESRRSIQARIPVSGSPVTSTGGRRD